MSILDIWLQENEKKYVKWGLTGDTEVDETLRPPSTYYFLTALGDMIFLRARSRADAQALLEAFNLEWTGNKNTYTLRTSRKEKSSGDTTCTGTQTRRGQSK